MKDRYISVGLMLSRNFLKEERSDTQIGSSDTYVYSKTGEITPFIAYSKEKHFNTKWSFNGEICFGRNQKLKSDYYSASIGIRYRL
jgi:hypothetical protein